MARVTIDPNQLVILPGIEILIGIDPDLQESGYSVWNRKEGKVIMCTKLRFSKVITTTKLFDKASTQIIMSAGWKLDATFFDKRYRQMKYNSLPPQLVNARKEAQARYVEACLKKIKIDVGKNHAAGILLTEVLQEYGYNVSEQPPRESKWTAAYFQMLTKIKSSNQELIDSMQLIYGR